MRVIVNNTIYDITTFINEHPGGPDVFRTNNIYNDSNQGMDGLGGGGG